MSDVREVCGAGPLVGEIEVPGDKSISHRALMFGALAQGETRIVGLLKGEDNLSTLKAFQAMGIEIVEDEFGVIHVEGKGLHGLSEPADVIDCGNSGTTMRLMTGILAGQKFFSVLTGDQYLRRRPMGRVVKPLAQMGGRFWGRDQGSRAPLAIQGSPLTPIDYSSAVASAQVKSALLLAGLYAKGTTRVFEPHLSRDHSERMLGYFGVTVERLEGGVAIAGGQELTGRDITVPGDISSAAFFLVAALVVPGSDLLIRQVGVNPTRSGIIDILQAMGGDIRLENPREVCGEPVADLRVRASRLHGIDIGGELVPRAIDEFPVISVAAALAEGTTVIRDAAELRVKETDRISAMVHALRALGATVEDREDGMVLQGGSRLGGGRVESCGDHRIAMSMAVAGLAADGTVSIHDTACTATSFPTFWQLLEQLKAPVRQVLPS